MPFTEIVHDRVMLEVARGCTRGCRFCQAGILYRPQRERSMPHLLELARKLLANTGYEEMSLSSLSTGDYSHLPELARALVEEHGCNRVAISLPSLRIDSVLGDTLEQTQTIKKTGLTFAPEAGSQRLRDVINKGVTEEQLRARVHEAFEKGWSAVKLYTMCGLPTETNDDLEGIANLAKAVVDEYFSVPKEIRQKGLRVSVSTSSFVPKPFTPFQWEPQNTMEQLAEKQKVKFVYGILERQFRSYYEKATRMEGRPGENLLILVERRLDNVVYRLGFAMTRREARQLVNHGHFTVNGQRVDIPSYLVKPGDVVEVAEKSRSSVKFKRLTGEDAVMVTPPQWLEREKNALKGTVTKLPAREDIDMPIEEHLIVELYSK